MATEVYISPAPAAQELAAELIPEHHKDLRRARILFLETTQAMRRRDRVKLASATKTSALLRYLSSAEAADVARGADFIILIQEEEWRFLDAAQRRALVDHELQQCYLRERVTKKGEIKQSWALRAPDIEEFKVIIERHGFWRPELRQFAHAAQQLPLYAAAAEPPDGAALVDEIARRADGQTIQVRDGVTATVTAGRKRKPDAAAAPPEPRQFTQAVATAEPPIVCYECRAPVPDGTPYYRDVATGTRCCATCFERIPAATSLPAAEPAGVGA